MTPSHAAKGSVRYRYYVSATDSGAVCMAAERISAGELEAAVLASLSNLFGDASELLNLIGGKAGAGTSMSIANAAQATALRLADALPSSLRELVQLLDLKVEVLGETITASVDAEALARHVGAEAAQDGRSTRVELPVAIAKRQRGHEIRMSAPAAESTARYRDGRLIALLVKAHSAHRALVECYGHDDDADSYSTKHLARMARLSFIAPDIVAAIMEGRQPALLTARVMLRASNVPLRWVDQRRAFGFG